MNHELRKNIVRLLEAYQKNQQQIALLHYELKHPASLSPEEMIDTMSFVRGEGRGGVVGTVSDKTMYIALNYQEKLAKGNEEVITEISKRLVELEQERDRLHYYVSLLSKRQEEVIRLYYFEGYSWDEVARKMNVALRTTHKIKNQAIDHLTEMYGFTEVLR